MKKSVTKKSAPVAKKSAKVAKVAAPAKAADVVAKKPGRESKKFAHKHLFPSPEVKKANPRRAGVHGFRSLEIIRKHPGIEYEAFMAAGGRRNDLNWDVERDRVILK